MRLAPFKYLRWRSILTLMIVLVLSTMLSSVTALSLLSFHKGLSAYMGEGEDIIVIYDKMSRTPITGLVPAFLADRITTVDDVLACSPEVIAPSIVNGESIFIRGVIPEELLKINNVIITDGEMLSLKDSNYAIVGRRAAERLNLTVGDKILVIGVLTPTYLELKVKGVFTSNTPLDDEIIAPLHVGQWLRGAGYNQATILRTKVSESTTTKETISNKISEASSEPEKPAGGGSTQPQSSTEQPIARWATIRFKPENINIKDAEKFIEDYMGRYGATRESILVLSIVTLIFSGAAIILAAQTLISQHTAEVEVLRSIGASKKHLRRDITLKLAPITIAASALGVGLAYTIITVALERRLLQVLFHSAQPYLDVPAIALIISTALAIAIVGIWRAIK